MTTIPLELHRELSKHQEQAKEMSTFRSMVLLTVCGVAIYLVLFAFYFALPQL
jgi:hypothetical protein